MVDPKREPPEPETPAQVVINKYRLMHLAIAEAVDAWRIIPRILITAYVYLLSYIIWWYINLKPYLMKDCIEALGVDVASKIDQCIVQQPSTQHAVLVSAIVGIAAAIFGFYASTGRRWTEGVHKWPSRPVDVYANNEMPYDPYPSPYYPPPHGGHGGYDPNCDPIVPPVPGAPIVPPVSVKPPPGDDV